MAQKIGNVTYLSSEDPEYRNYVPQGLYGLNRNLSPDDLSKAQAGVSADGKYFIPQLFNTQEINNNADPDKPFVAPAEATQKIQLPQKSQPATTVGGKGGALDAVGSGASAGGSVGSLVGGPLGGAVGSVIGGLVGGVGSAIASGGKSLYNPEYDRLRKEYADALASEHTAFENAAGFDPTTNFDLGLDNARNTRNFMDKNYLRDVATNLRTSQIEGLGAALKQARANASMTGIKGGSDFGAGLSSQINRSTRETGSKYSDVYKTELESAYRKQLNAIEQRKQALRAAIEAAMSKTAKARLRADSESAGLFQDPNISGELLSRGIRAGSDIYAEATKPKPKT